ncbi:Iron transport multicopper oxidase FET3 [Orchesella cincta]|uniref:Iron transport multicopper oxidase FET3 n=1 Tax=Orchesella cincta TaxID=48709 RepID=A0A1D2MB89_ORCCI|nr:Iron transport multicopper oxidase FET3 [Orchesella cincta]
MHIKTFLFLLITNTCIISSNGKIVKHTLNISYFPGYPDGVWKQKVLGINGQFPGPTLEATEGDTLEILVVNNIQDGQNTSIHWHGIHQKGTPFEDGSSQITQCPLPSQKSQTYRFKATEPGTHWYHSHERSQYTEGLYGALLVHAQKEAYVYDDEITITLSDWYHPPAWEIEEWVLANVSNRVPPIPDSGLMNGMGRYPCKFAERKGIQCDSKKQRRPVFNLEKNKTYRVRVINAASVASFNFSIDDHILQTIEVDGVDVQKSPNVYVDVAYIAAGQRYSFLFRCGDNSRYLIRGNMRTEFLLLGGKNINKYPEALMGDVTGVIKCFDKKHGYSEPLSTSEKFSWKDVLPSQFKPKSSPVYLDEMKLSPLDGSRAPHPADQEFTLNVHFEDNFENIRLSSFNNSPFVLPTRKPLLISVIDGDVIPKTAFPLEIQLGNVIQLIINNPFDGPHPFHLHGHHFWVLGLGKRNDGNFTNVWRALTLDGVKRDTVVVEERSWAVLRFVADNPGVWLFHCHIDWHNLSGMSLVFIEGKDVLSQQIRVGVEADRICGMHDDKVSSSRAIKNTKGWSRSPVRSRWQDKKKRWDRS